MDKQMFKKIVLLSSLIIVLSGCDNSLEKNILGKWAYELTLPIDDGNMTGEGKAKCLSDYYPNKSATHNCDFLYSKIVFVKIGTAIVSSGYSSNPSSLSKFDLFNL